MSALVLCAACEFGDHDNHDGKHHGPPGVIGGHHCPCPGGCVPQPNPLLEALDQAIKQARAARPTPPEAGQP